MLAPQASCVKELEEWETAWQNSKIGFHKPGVHKYEKYSFVACQAGELFIEMSVDRLAQCS